MMSELSSERVLELRDCIKKMQNVSDAFYQGAINTGNHAFIEFCGLMNEYIKVCYDALNEGIDFTMANKHTGQALPLKMHHSAYLGEKIGCIYGEMLADPANWHIFSKAAHK